MLFLMGELDETVWSVKEWWSPNWANASNESVSRGDLKISVLTATKRNTEFAVVGGVNTNPLKPDVRTEEMIHILLRIENIGARDVHLRPWGKDQRDTASHTRLTDDVGRLYPRVYLHFADINWVNGRPVPKDAPLEKIGPGGKVEHELIFKYVSSEASFFRLELAASRFGGFGWFKFQIPKEMVTIKKEKDD
jgi:hypothetical protein